MWIRINNDKELNTLAFFIRNERDRFKEIRWRAHKAYPISVGLDEWGDNDIVFGLVLKRKDSRKAAGDTSLSSFLRAKKEKWSQKVKNTFVNN